MSLRSWLPSANGVDDRRIAALCQQADETRQQLDQSMADAAAVSTGTRVADQPAPVVLNGACRSLHSAVEVLLRIANMVQVVREDLLGADTVDSIQSPTSGDVRSDLCVEETPRPRDDALVEDQHPTHRTVARLATKMTLSWSASEVAAGSKHSLGKSPLQDTTNLQHSRYKEEPPKKQPHLATSVSCTSLSQPCGSGSGNVDFVSNSEPDE